MTAQTDAIPQPKVVPHRGRPKSRWLDGRPWVALDFWALFFWLWLTVTSDQPLYAVMAIVFAIPLCDRDHDGLRLRTVRNPEA